MNIQFIYFDLDDTLLDHTKAQTKSLAEVYEKFRFDKYLSLADFDQNYHQINKALWIQYGNHEISKEQLKKRRFKHTLEKCAIQADWRSVSNFYMHRYQQNWRWIFGAQELIRVLSNRMPIGFLTNGFRNVQKKKYTAFNLDQYSKTFVISEEVGIMKPQPGIFDHATELTGCQAHEILYIGDSLISDVKGGVEYGWNVVWHNYGNGNKDGQDRDHNNANMKANGYVFSYTHKKELSAWLDDIL